MINKEEMKLPEDFHMSHLGITIKPYLTLGEVRLIGDEMIKTDDWCEREIILNQYILQFCVREADEFDGMEYEAIKHSGTFSAIRNCVKNLDDVYDYVEQATSVRKELGDFLKAVVDLATRAEKKIPAAEELKKSFEAFQKLQEKQEDEGDASQD